MIGLGITGLEVQNALYQAIDNEVSLGATNATVQSPYDAAALFRDVWTVVEADYADSFNRCRVIMKNSQTIKIIKDDPRLLDTIRDIHQRGAYIEILSLDTLTEEKRSLLWRPNNELPLSVSELPSKKATENSWILPFRGCSTDAFLHNIDDFLGNIPSEKAYARMTSLFQASGTGKSRLLDEVAKERLVIPVNLRNPNAGGFPPSDPQARVWLTDYRTRDQRRVLARSIAFVSALLSVTTEKLRNIDIVLNDFRVPNNAYVDNLCSKFRALMAHDMNFDTHGKARTQFMDEVVLKAMKIYSIWYPSSPTINPQNDDSAMSVDRPNPTHPSSPPPLDNNAGDVITLQAEEAGKELLALLIPDVSKHHLASTSMFKVILVFDEAHNLLDMTNSLGVTWSAFSELRRALRSLQRLPIFSVFLSTTGSASRFAPSVNDDPSNRVARGGLKIMHPILELGFDLYARNIKSGTVSVATVATLEFMVKFGRPLFASRWEAGDEAIRAGILEFAAQKLVCQSTTTATTLSEDKKLACIISRIQVPLHPTSMMHPENFECMMVEKYMRICTGMNEECTSITTITASEPLLAEAARSIMMMDSFSAPITLLNGLQRSWINKGDRGELIGMLLLLLAQDRARKLILSVSGEVSTATFLSKLPRGGIDHILNALPSNRGGEDVQPLRKVFDNACVWFNHYIKVLDYKMINRTHLWKFAARGAAILCADNQRGIDILIPIVLDRKGKLEPDNMSAILVQIKNDISFGAKPRQKLFDAMDPVELEILDEDTDVPFIRIVFALAGKKAACVALEYGKKPEVDVTTTQRKFVAYDIWFSGVSHETFGCINEGENHLYRNLLQRNPLNEVLNEKHHEGSQAIIRGNYALALEHDDHSKPFIL